LLIAASALHRVNFRVADKRTIVIVSNALTFGGIGVLAVALAGVMVLISDALFGAIAAILAGCASAALLAGLWAVLPLRERVGCASARAAASDPAAARAVRELTRSCSFAALVGRRRRDTRTGWHASDSDGAGGTRTTTSWVRCPAPPRARPRSAFLPRCLRPSAGPRTCARPTAGSRRDAASQRSPWRSSMSPRGARGTRRSRIAA
jgi:hypothetical protein